MRRIKKIALQILKISNMFRGGTFWNFFFLNNSNDFHLDGKKLEMSFSSFTHTFPSPPYRPVPCPLNT